MRVTVIGAGYVGCVTAACLAKRGHQIIAVDTDNYKVGEINAGRSPVLEPGLEELVKEQVDAGRLKANLPGPENLADAHVAIVCVATPSAEDGSVDTRPMQRVFAQLAEATKDRTERLVVAVRSTIAPDRLGEVVAAIPEDARDRLPVVANPEFLRETTALADFDNPPFIVIGGEDEEAMSQVAQLYNTIDAPIFKVNVPTAFLVKYACNAFHGLKIAFANEVGLLAEQLGADPLQTMSIFCKDDILNLSKVYLRPGFGFGGSCLPKDLRALQAAARQHNEQVPVIDATLESNVNRIQRVADVILADKPSSLTMIGVSFKRGTDDLRESPYLRLGRKLQDAGVTLRIFDPDVAPDRLVGANLTYASSILPGLPSLLVKDLEEALEGSDAVVLCKQQIDAKRLAKLAETTKIHDIEYIAARTEGVSDVPSPYSVANPRK